MLMPKLAQLVAKANEIKTKSRTTERSRRLYQKEINFSEFIINEKFKILNYSINN